MKKKQRAVSNRCLAAVAFIAALVLLVAAFPVWAQSVAAPQSSAQPYDLRCEYLTDPLGIDVETPRFSWKLRDRDEVRGQKQTGYQVLVASRKSLLDQDQADVWDSGKVSSAQSVLVPFGGKPLVSNQDCYWEVRVFDKDQRPTGWSPVARFSMGLLAPGDWKSPWMSHPKLSSGPTAKAVDVTKAVADQVANDRLSVKVWLTLTGGKDPAPKTVKKLTVTYRAAGEEKTVSALDGDMLEIAGKNLEIVRAVYGDYPVPVIEVGPMLRQKPKPQRAALVANLKTFSHGHDLAPGREKSLLVRYRAGGPVREKQIPLNQQLAALIPEISAPGFEVESAWFGDLTALPLKSADFDLANSKSLPAEQHLWFRKRLDLRAAPRQAFIHVASCGYHELYVNGKKADNRLLAPSLTRLDKRILYVTYDVAPLLRAGGNVIAVATGPGWSLYGHFRVSQALRVQLNGTYPDGTAFTSEEGGTWRSHAADRVNRGAIKFSDNGGELVDGRLSREDWNALGFDDSRWDAVKPMDWGVALSAHLLEPARVIKELPAVRTWAEGSAHRFDLGENFTGWLEIKLRGQKSGDRILIKVADDAKTIQDFGQLSEYICKGGGEEVFKHRFNYVAGRYVTIEGLAGTPKLGDVKGLALANDLERTGHFTSSSKLFNQIYETDLWTFRANTIEGYTADCPHRERLGYGEVVFATAWGIGLPNYQFGAFGLKHVRDWADVQETNGWIHHTAPQINRHFGGPMWSSAGINTANAFYAHFGDAQVYESIYPAAIRWLQFLRDHTKDGLLTDYSNLWGRFLGDWAAPNQRKERGGTPEALYFNNCVYAMNLQYVIEMAQVLGKASDAAVYQKQLDALRPAIHQRFFNTDRNTYMNGTMVQQAFALLTGIVPEEHRAAVFQKIRDDLAADRAYLDMGSSGLPVLFRYMTEQSGESGLLFKALSSTVEPSYGYFLARGETTWPEYWNVDMPSRIHTCYTGVSSWMMKSLAGIRPDPAQPGYQSFLIAPVLVGDLTFAKATTESPYGLIRSSWERQGDRITLNVTIPPNSTATVYLPTSDANGVTERGQDIRRAVGVTPAGTDGKQVTLNVASGSYEFQFASP